MEERRTEVLVVGAGVVGLSIAWELVRAGREVLVVDPAPGSGASYAAAGMLAAVSEYHYQEERLLGAMLDSCRRWPAFAASLGSRVGFTDSTTLCVGAHAADRRLLADLREVQRQHGLDVRALAIKEARHREPSLSPQIAGAFEVPEDRQVDPRAVVAAILERLDPAALLGVTAEGLLGEEGGVRGVRLVDGREIVAKETIVANGLGARDLSGLPRPLPLRPVHGDILRLRVPPRLRPLLGATLRGVVGGRPVYLVPRPDGGLVIGASQREDGEAGVSAGEVYALLRDAQELVPAVAELELVEATARARPGTPDNAPLLGRMRGKAGEDVPGLIVATGFFRHGVLLAPWAAQACAGIVAGAPPESGGASPLGFRPDRFEPGPRRATGGENHEDARATARDMNGITKQWRTIR